MATDNNVFYIITSNENHSITTTKTEDQVDGSFFLDVVVREGSVVFELLSSEDKTLLVGWDGLFVLNLVLEVLYGVGRFHV